VRLLRVDLLVFLQTWLYLYVCTCPVQELVHWLALRDSGFNQLLELLPTDLQQDTHAVEEVGDGMGRGARYGAQGRSRMSPA
jgi:hypothetical protein